MDAVFIGLIVLCYGLLVGLLKGCHKLGGSV